jgi:hypothetical protein
MAYTTAGLSLLLHHGDVDSCAIATAFAALRGPADHQCQCFSGAKGSVGTRCTIATSEELQVAQQAVDEWHSMRRGECRSKFWIIAVRMTAPQTSPPDFKAPKANVWSGLTDVEAASVTQWLFAQSDLNLTV